MISYPDPPLIFSIDFIPPYFFVISDLNENNGTPFAPIPICPIGVSVFCDLMLGEEEYASNISDCQDLSHL